MYLSQRLHARQYVAQRRRRQQLLRAAAAQHLQETLVAVARLHGLSHNRHPGRRLPLLLRLRLRC